MEDLSKLDSEQLESFLNSFDYVVCDIDGVIFERIYLAISGARNCIEALRALDKKIAYLSNNCLKPFDKYVEQLKSEGFAEDNTELITPALAIVDYLQKNNFDKEIYAVAMEPLRDHLRLAGFKLANNELDAMQHDINNIIPTLSKLLKDDHKIGAVLIDTDLNISFNHLQRALRFLKRPEVHFILSGVDKVMPYDGNNFIIGPGCFQDIITSLSQREPIILAKPGLDIGEFLKNQYNITDPSRVLFVGDSIPSDMAFATNCGFKKLLVLSGATSIDEINDWTYPEEYKPDYYAGSLKTLYEKISGKLTKQ